MYFFIITVDVNVTASNILVKGTSKFLDFTASYFLFFVQMGEDLIANVHLSF